jgi:hypothetical protein
LPNELLETQMSFPHRILPLVTSLLVTACDSPPAPSSAAEDPPPVLPGTESSTSFDGFTVHFNAVATNQLSADVASQYGIVRSTNRALLNISVLRDAENAPAIATNATVSAMATNLSGQLKALTMRPINEGDAVYYVGEIAITNGETLIFTVHVTPEGETEDHTFRFMKQFFVN